MSRKSVKILLGTAATLVGLVVYFVITSVPLFTQPAQARPAEMPAQPHIVYVAPHGSSRGVLNSELASAHGATPVTAWSSARSAATTRPLDAILIDLELMPALQPSDKDWLKAQFWDGVVVVGLGTDDDLIAEVLELETIRSTNEANHLFGPIEYILVSGLRLGDPNDLTILDNTNWLQRLLDGNDDDVPATIQQPTMFSFGKMRGSLETEREITRLFTNLRSFIEGTYRARSQFQAQTGN